MLLPLEEPLGVAEDAAVVDALSGGRLELGIDHGGDLVEFVALAAARKHTTRTRPPLLTCCAALFAASCWAVSASA